MKKKIDNVLLRGDFGVTIGPTLFNDNKILDLKFTFNLKNIVYSFRILRNKTEYNRRKFLDIMAGLAYCSYANEEFFAEMKKTQKLYLLRMRFKGRTIFMKFLSLNMEQRNIN